MIWYESDNPGGFVSGKRFSIDAPSVTIMAFGMGSDSYSHWHLIFDDRPDPTRPDPMIDKPPYRVPSMAEIAAIPWNGRTVVSTFSGCGGSCLGYRMAGFRVLWANEFVPIAQESYRANHHGSILDGRDIHKVQPADILAATGLEVGELDLFDGSPPCQAFSMAGKRDKGWGQNKQYEHGAKQKNETLFDQYIRLLNGLRPKVFIAENVGGLVKGVAKGYFLSILAEMKSCGYRVTAKLLDAQWLGVPQARQRLIFVGVRDDLGLDPAFPKPLPYRYSVRDAIPWIVNVAVTKDRYSEASTVPAADGDQALVIHDTCGFVKNKDITDRPCPTITTGVNSSNSSNYLVAYRDQRGAFGNGGDDISDRPAPSVLAGTAGNLWLGTHKGVRSVDEPAPTVLTHGRGFSEQSIVSPIESEIRLVCPSRRNGKGFNSMDIEPDRPSGTVMASNPGNDLCVPSRLGRRKFTIAELRRICAFPDDFILEGSYAKQWERLGNSVPPVMMAAIAETIRDEIFANLPRSATPS